MEHILSVKTEDYEISIPLRKRITYLRGNSGVGKTTLAQLVDIKVKNDDPLIDLSTPEGLSVEVINSVGLVTDIKSRYNCIIIIDDNLGTESPSFPKVISSVLKDNNNYLVIINRVDNVLDSLASTGNSSFEYDAMSILWVERIEGCIKREVNPLLYTLKNISSFNTVNQIICEDKYGMKQFCDNYNLKGLDIKTSEGKDNILFTLLNLSSKYSSVFLYVDLISFGQCLSDLYSISEVKGYTLKLDCDYLSFEYFILNTNYFKDLVLKDDVDTDEHYYEFILERESISKLGYKYKHGKSVPICLLKDCNGCGRFKGKHCDKIIDADKLAFMVDSTEYEYIKSLLRGDV